MGDKINLALIGAGHWGKNLARVFFEFGILKSICDSSEDILKIKSAKYPQIATTASFADTLDSSDINAVAIATPAAQHYYMAKEALLADKHVFVEKPLSMTVKEGGDLVQIAEQRGKTLFVDTFSNIILQSRLSKICFRKISLENCSISIPIG